MKSTGNRIQEAREALGISRAELARRLDSTRMTIWRIETGKVQVPADHLRDFARALKTPVESLVA